LNNENKMQFGLNDHTIKSLEAIFASFDFVTKVILYGSRAKGNYRHGSDIDLSVVGDQLTLNEITKVSLAIDELNLPWKVDLSLYHQIENHDLIDHLKRVGIPFYLKELSNIKKGLNPVVNQYSKILILGSFPSDQSLINAEYYSNPSNKFWEIMFSVLDRPLTSYYKDRITLLKENQIALWDVIQECERSGSQDKNITNEKINNFKDFYSSHPNIEYIFFSSLKACNLYKRKVKHIPNIAIQLLPSTSSLNTRQTFQEKLKNWSIIKKFL